ncbi:MFS family permease [Polynucleobacter sphagniphilus]|uniref:MFS transporter n=1 Tax=Polynucleobacter sphagniphilus TaxID=1743169 RepID=UPI0024747D62|nr:MFS transporter [Polynucleobacter sphagniphilus]MDH6241263.1 MFS family permease [Polynucleobacter sphagniphilus]MDH6524384.1 MFS family permease [Polynucleobacter sphagniphilus]
MSTTHPPSFAALRIPAYRFLISAFLLTMMADNIEHVISYWMMFQQFHSPELGGFAVISHWLPYLVFSVPAGALADRFDPRRLIQIGMLMFMFCSLAWGYFFLTDSLQLWEAMALLVLHGCSGVLWMTSTQIILYDVVGKSNLPSGIRLLATARYLGLLVGPAVGALMMLGLGPKVGIILNACFYLPNLIWLMNAPCGPKFRDSPIAPPRAFKGFKDIFITAQEIAHEYKITSMILLAGAASFFIGNSYQAQMPGFAQDLGHGDPGILYSTLLAADAAGALLAGLLLESREGILKTSPITAIGLAVLWCASLLCFALSEQYLLAILCLFIGGFFELSFNSMAQTIVQLNAPLEIRGRVIGLFNMSALGMRAGAGITVGLLGGMIGIHWSLAISATCLIAVSSTLYWRFKHKF